MLGNLIKLRKTGHPQPPQPVSRLPFIHKKVSREVAGTKTIDKVDFNLGLSSGDGPSELDYDLLISLKTTVDSSGRPDEFIPIKLALGSEKEFKISESKPLKVTLKKGEDLSGSAFGEVHSAWMTCWTITLEVRKEGKTND